MGKREHLLLAFFTCFLCVEFISCNPVKAIADKYRLPGGIVPERYKIDLTVEADFYETAKFTGTVVITITPTDMNLKTITLHAANLSMDVTNFALQLDDVPEPIAVDITKYDYDDLVEQATITLAQALEQNKKYTLTITNYEGILHGDMHGFYLSSYTDNEGETQWIATTQLQSTYARRAFPCFDEPAFKAVFAITLKRPIGYTTLSNTKQKTTTLKAEGDLEVDTYADTPIMSTYLIAFIISKFKPYGDASGTYNVWSREEALPTANYSYQIGPKILTALETYTNYKYYDKMINKMDQVAIPDFAAGAMENWGLVTYRETALLWDPLESTADYKQRVATVIAHEFAHMWFGNLVTLEFWSHTWLNEGFARYFQYYITAEVEDTWELEKQFVIQQQQSIFGSDALTGALPLSSPVSTPSEISNKFASISYNKGASVIRMMKNMLGDEKFQKGIRTYLVDNEFDNTVPQNLWDALSEHFDNSAVESRDFDTIMTGWIEKAGFPVVTVKMNNTDAELSQKRFLLNSEEEDAATWDIPITYATSHEKRFENTTVTHWLLSDENLVIDNILHGEPGWVIVNIQETGYYRVNYDDTLWDALEDGLNSENFDGVHVLNRAQIVDDALNLARAGIIPYKRALDVTSFLEKETEYYPWYSALNAFAFLKRRLDHESANGMFLQKHILTLLESMYTTVSFDIKSNLGHVDTLKTALILQWACDLSENECIENAKVIFDKHKDDADRIDPNIRSIVYCTAVRDHYSKENWDFLWGKFNSTSLATEQAILLTAMGCAKNADVLKDYLTMSITEGSGIRKQDASSVFTAVLAGTPEGVGVAFDFFQENLSDIVSFYEGMNALSTVINGIADRLTTKEQVADFKTFINEHKEELKDAAHQAETAIANAEANIKWVESKTDELHLWFKDTYGGASQISLSISLLLVILSITLYL